MITLFSLDEKGQCHAIAYPLDKQATNEVKAQWGEWFPNRNTYSLEGRHKGPGKKLLLIKNGKVEIDNNGEPLMEDDPEVLLDQEIEEAKEKVLLEGALEHLSVKAKEKAEARLNKTKNKSLKS